MRQHMNIYLLLAFAIPSGWLTVQLVRLFKRTRAYISRVSVCGYIAPTPTPRSRRFFEWFTRAWRFYQVGSTRMIGRNNLNADGPAIVVVNHTHYIDTAVLYPELDRPLRYLAAQRLYEFLWGLPSLIAAPCGFIPVSLQPGRGGPAREAAVNLLSCGESQTLVIHPEGFAYMDGTLGPFKNGAVRIAKESARRLGKPIKIIPIMIRYNRYPGSWIRKWDAPLQYIWLFFNAWRYRRGATMVIGTPISSDELPANHLEATELLRSRVAALALEIQSQPVTGDGQPASACSQGGGQQ